MRLRAKLTFGAVIILLLAAVTGAVLLYSSSQVTREMNKISAVNNLIRGEFELVMLTQDFLLQHSARSQEQWQAKYAAITGLIENIKPDKAGEAESIEEIKNSHNDIGEQFKLLMDNRQSGNADGQEASSASEFADRIGGQIMVTTQSIESLVFAMAEEHMANALKTEQRGKLLVGLSLLSLIVVLCLIMLTGWRTTTVLMEATNVSASITTEIAATVDQHERSISQQASMVNQTTTTIQELGVSSSQTSEQASSAADVAQNALKSAGEGTSLITQALDSMNGLAAKVGSIAEQVLLLGEQTAQIGNLAQMVKDLSNEINMLALNAAVEAARAGEHGKGFAVVAGEVRKLANESKKSAMQSSALIAEIQKATNATILKTEEGTRMVEDVTGYACSVGELFDSLSGAANKVYENAQQVMLNTKQQATAISQVVQAMNSLNTGARETSTGILQTKTAIERLNSTVINLKQIS